MIDVVGRSLPLGTSCVAEVPNLWLYNAPLSAVRHVYWRYSWCQERTKGRTQQDVDVSDRSVWVRPSFHLSRQNRRDDLTSNKGGNKSSVGSSLNDPSAKAAGGARADPAASAEITAHRSLKT